MKKGSFLNLLCYVFLTLNTFLEYGLEIINSVLMMYCASAIPTIAFGLFHYLS